MNQKYHSTLLTKKEEFKPSKLLIEKVITFFYKGGQYTAKAVKRGDSHYKLLEGNFKGQEIHVMKLIH